MGILEAIIIGIIQGLTEFLPVSSSGHIELAKAILHAEELGIDFSVLVHVATALSSVIIFREKIASIFSGLFEFKANESWNYSLKLILSAIPVVIIGLGFEDQIDAFFQGNLVLVGAMLMVTAGLLFLTIKAPDAEGEVTWGKALIIGLAQAIAVLPGISRSGSTISTALLLGVNRQKAAEFSFIMVLIPIFGKALLDIKDIVTGEAVWSLPVDASIAGFIAAFITGLFACYFMLRLVTQGRLHYFSIYCAIIGLIAILVGMGVF